MKKMPSVVATIIIANAEVTYGKRNTEESVGKLKEAEFYERFGIGSVFFGVLLDRLKKCHEEQHMKGGRPNLLSVF